MFKVGNKVRVITKVHGVEQFGMIGILEEVFNGRDFIYHVQFPGRKNVYRLGEIELVIEEPVAPKEAPMTRFVFCSRGGKYYEKGDYDSLEEATIRAKELRRRYRTVDIHPFVIVED